MPESFETTLRHYVSLLGSLVDVIEHLSEYENIEVELAARIDKVGDKAVITSQKTKGFRYHVN